MQRWFFADQAEVCVAPKPKEESSHTSIEKESEFKPTFRPWTFSVKVERNLCGNEFVALTGGIEALGNWQLKTCLEMENSETDNSIWTKTLDLPLEEATQYRYLICARGICSNEETIIIRFWESHFEPRTVPEFAENIPIRHETFGLLDDILWIDRGWITSETMVQIKFFNAPFTWKTPPKLKQELLLYVKIIPMHIKRNNECATSDYPLMDRMYRLSKIKRMVQSLSGDLYDDYDYDQENRSEAFSFCEVGMLKGTESNIGEQPQYGTLCSQNDLLIFHLRIGDFENTAYMVNLFLYSYKNAPDEVPWHFGYHYILPEVLQNAQGTFTVPITCASTHRPLGIMHLGYHIIKPAKCLELDTKETFSRYWHPDCFGIHIGHRGSGPSGPDSVLRENTILSMKNAFDHGADMVELDVQLTKDLVPIVFHDFNIRLSYKSKHPDVQDYHIHSGKPNYRLIPVSKFTWEQMLNLKDTHEKPPPERCSNLTDLRQYQCIQMLSDIFELLPPELGINIEVKWAQLLGDCQYEEDFKPQMDRNEYVDIILDLVFRKAGSRKIIFSCFDPDICTMIRFKQNRYPVMQLVIGSTKLKNEKFMDPRGNCMYLAMSQALAMEFLGVVTHCGNLLEDPCQIGTIKRTGLILFCYGGCSASDEVRKMLKDWGIHGIIYDEHNISGQKIGPSTFELLINEIPEVDEEEKCRESNAKKKLS